MNKIKKSIFTVVFTGMIIVAIFAVYAFHIEPLWIETTRFDVALPDYPKDAPPLKIVQLADFHADRPHGLANTVRAVRISNKLKPDIVVLTGDFVTTDAAAAVKAVNELKKLESKYGVFAVLGNHDYWSGGAKVAKIVEAGGIRMLTNRNIIIPGRLRLIGLDDPWTSWPNTEKAFASVRPEEPEVVICHSPIIIKLLKGRNALIITSHTHAGQADIPGIPRNKLPGLRGWKYIRGWYDEGKAMMYVNRGLGNVGPAIRFRCRPEITQYTIHAK